MAAVILLRATAWGGSRFVEPPAPGVKPVPFTSGQASLPSLPSAFLPQLPVAAVVPIAVERPTPFQALQAEAPLAEKAAALDGTHNAAEASRRNFARAAGFEDGPVAPQIPHEIELHGRPWSDSYAWMKTYWKKEPSPELLRHIQAENSYSRRYFDKNWRRQSALLKEFKAQSFAPLSPTGVGSGKNYRSQGGSKRDIPRLARKTRDGWKTVVDLSTFLPPETRWATLEDWKPSPDGKKFILDVLVDGAARTFVHDARRGRTIELSQPTGLIDSSVWSSDGSAVLYAQNTLLLNRGRILSRRLDDDGPPAVVYASDDDTAYLQISKTRDGKYVTIGVNSYARRETLALAADAPAGTAPVLLSPMREGSYAYAESLGGRLILRANDGAGHFNVRDAADPSKILVAGSPESDIMDVAVFGDRALVTRRVRSNPVIEVYDSEFKLLKTITFPEAHYELNVLPQWDAKTGRIWIRQTSLLRPEALYTLDGKNRLRLRSATKTPKLKAKDYVLEKRFYKSADGTEVPMTLVYKKGFTGLRPVYYGAYGAYDAPYDLEDDHAYSLAFAQSLMDRGFIVAIGHVRGGTEKGHQWMLDGRREKRAKSVDDFIAGAEFLVASGLADPKKIAAHGYSAGGALIASALNRRPELFGAAIVNMGFLDYVNSQLDADIPAAALEWALWGNPAVSGDFEFMARFSPYDNMKAQAYPPMLVNSARDDWAVLFHEAAKYTARLRATRTGNSTLLLHVLAPKKGDHDGTYRRHDLDAARSLAFVLREFGVK